MAEYRFEDIAINSTEKKKPVESDKEHYLGLEHLDSGTFKVSRFGSEVAPIGDKLIMKKGDVLFGKRRAYQKKVAIAPFDGIFSAHGMVLRPKEDVIDKNFFPLFIASDYFLDAAIKISVGSLSPTINWRDLKELKFNLPELDEQKKLAEVLWQIVDTIESYKKLLAKTDEMVKAKFNELLLENKRTIKIKDLVELPIKKISKDTKYNEIQYIDISSIDKDLRIIQGTTNYQLNNAPSRAKQIVKKNDILISTVRPNLKTFATINIEADNLIASTGFCVLRAQNCPLYYLYGIINSDIFTNQMISEATGISYPAVNDGNILNFKIPDISEEQQKYLADLVAKSEESKSAIKASLDSLTKIYKKIIAENIGGK